METIMVINEMTEKECRDILSRASFGKLGCALENQPYVIPINFAYDGMISSCSQPPVKRSNGCEIGGCPGGSAVLPHLGSFHDGASRLARNFRRRQFAEFIAL